MILKLEDVKKTYDSPPGRESAPVLNGVSLDVARGEAIAVVGPSGSGKSTLLNIIGALDRPSSGTVMFDAENLAQMTESRLARIRNRDIGFVFQLHHLLPQCTVLENVLIPTLPLGKNLRRDELKRRAEDLLGRAGLEGRMDYFPAQLSGGERQRTAVVRALINNPKLLLADEPSGSLDQSSAESLGGLLLQLNREQELTLIVVTHSPDLAKKMDTVYRLHLGVLEKL